ncbi:alpha/beta hydrolase [Streptomyces spectabilis]|uniref:Alpha/beta hydrolase n=1 Tax=Streptomyces spectabilis TaxID=68270 RepID=A0A5P2X9N8_STRST|nr:alpha/beta hydrolase [Streptomyces spectabilis]MBB5109484.1 pimeloyl-ACP methyl ester carboxylesterase [Streptomyces spectabilis]MCI3904645.1 alpha/beta hydrolase [Streptomyces spectabilis]QEV61723.1 alpha/beta hydrolase [Streptomyces spectabilis]GGV54629.1 protease [Streptomyces spectabilis]
MDDSARRRPHTRRTAAFGAVVAALALAAPTAHAGTTTSGGLDRYHQQRLDWGSCASGPDDSTGRDLDKAGVRCADVTVPLDYAAPEGRTLTVAISRLKATDRRHRVGALLINPGGPGGTALDMPPDIREAMKETGARYDLIGMDPRFVGRSTPLDCGWPVSTAVLSAGAGRAGFERQVALQKRLADKCRATHSDVLPHVSTRNTARDMDVIRGALGERKLSYLGYSYGTYLGTVYTQMFPGRYDRVVLDGALDTPRYQPRLLRGAEPENQRALADWAAWAARRHATYGLGRSRDQVLATVDRIVAKSARGLTLRSGSDVFRVDDSHVPFLLVEGIADDTDAARAALGETVSVLADAAGKPARPSKHLAELLRYATTGVDSASGSAQTAILCGDVAAPRDPERYWRDIQRSRTRHPLFGPLTNNVTPCAFWDRPRERPTRVRHDARALIVAATGDPRAPYEGSVALRHRLPGSKLLTLKGANRHGIYGEYGNTCVDSKVNAYLATGRLPAKDETCAR